MNRVTFSRCNFTMFDLGLSFSEKNSKLTPHLTSIHESWKDQKPGIGLASFLEKNPTKIQKIEFWNVWERHFWKKNQCGVRLTDVHRLNTTPYRMDHAEFGGNDHRKDAPHVTIRKLCLEVILALRSSERLLGNFG